MFAALSAYGANPRVSISYTTAVLSRTDAFYPSNPKISIRICSVHVVSSKCRSADYK